MSDKIRLDRRKTIYLAALTLDGKLMVEKDFRIALNKFIYQLPCGVIVLENNESETIAVAKMLRELGYIANSVNLLFNGIGCPNLLDDKIEVYLAEGIRKIFKDDSESDEGSKVELVSITEFIPLNNLPYQLMRKMYDGELININLLAVKDMIEHHRIYDQFRGSD